MHIPAKQLKPLAGATLTPDEEKMLKCLRSAKWEPQTGERTPIPYKAKVPEFFMGVRLYNMQAGMGAGSIAPLEILIKKLEYQGIISKQDSYPLSGIGGARFLSLKKADMDNLGIGKKESDEDE